MLFTDYPLPVTMNAMEDKSLILIIDDTADFREIFSLKLKVAGFDVIEASSGEEGISKIKSSHPDLVLLDVEMPNLSGADTLERIKTDPGIKDTKVVFLTNYGESQENQTWLDNKFAEELGAIDYIRKTDDLDKIMLQIKENVNK